MGDEEVKEEVKDPELENTENPENPEEPQEPVDNRDLDELPVDALQMFKELPFLDEEKNIVTEESDAPVLTPVLWYNGDNSYVVSYGGFNDMGTLLSFDGDTPKQAIIRAYEHFFGKVEPDYPYEQPHVLEVAVRQLAMLPAMSRERGIVKDPEDVDDPLIGNIYDPVLAYIGPEDWVIEWVSKERGELGLEFHGETPEEAIQKAYDNFFPGIEPEELPKKDRTMQIIDGFNCCLGDITKEVKVEKRGIIITLERGIHLNREILNNILLIIPEENEFMYDPGKRLIIIKRASKCHCPAGDCLCNKPKPEPEEPNDDTGVEYPEIPVEDPEVIIPEPEGPGEELDNKEDGKYDPWNDFK